MHLFFTMCKFLITYACFIVHNVTVFLWIVAGWRNKLLSSPITQ